MNFFVYRPFVRPLLCAALLLTAPPFANAGPLLMQDFNGPNAWPKLSAPPVAGVSVKATRASVGTIDVANSTTPSGAVLLTVRNKAAGGAWNAAMTSGLLPVRTTETNLGKLTLSFDHSVSSVRPVTVRIESFNAARKRTGGLQGVVYPAAPNFYLRAALDLSTMHPFGAGGFRPTDPFVRLTFVLQNAPRVAENTPTELRVDNVEYASPAFYVSPTGSDTNDGRSEKTAFASPQKAVDLAHPGDIILLMDGTFHRLAPNTVQEGFIKFQRGGAPSGWIVVKNYPGQHPVLLSDSWNAIKIGRGSAAAPSTEPALAYLEVRGLHIRGFGDTIRTTHPELVGTVEPLTNGNGIGCGGDHEAVIPHHLRFADNVVEYCGGGGMGAGDCEYVTIENNTIRNNCWTTIYADSGISVGARKHFDAADNVYKCLIRNNTVSGNRCYEKWKSAKRVSDGNGIIIDTNYVPAKNQIALGRTLIQNNLSFNNGGSGIHAFRGHRVDIINNTAYWNGASPELRWGQIFCQICDDIKMTNNILVSRPDQPINSVGPTNGDQGSTNVVRSNNIYFGGLTPKLTGPGDVLADPQFVNASTDPATADFHVKSGSPALKSGIQSPLVPLLDLDGRPRLTATPPDKGAYQQ